VARGCLQPRELILAPEHLRRFRPRHPDRLPLPAQVVDAVSRVNESIGLR
jgi:hypothetical protein